MEVCGASVFAEGVMQRTSLTRVVVGAGVELAARAVIFTRLMGKPEACMLKELMVDE